MGRTPRRLEARRKTMVQDLAQAIPETRETEARNKKWQSP